MKLFRRLAVTSSITTLVLVAVGGLVRATGSGLGCLDEWPRCHGRWIAPLQFHAIIEYSHRFVAVIATVLALALAAAAFRYVKDRPALRAWSMAGLPLIVGQALLGLVIVKTDLHAAVVTGHFLLAMGLVAVTTGVAVASFGTPGAARSKLTSMTTGLIFSTLLLLVVGALVREKGAGLAFADWPLMNSTVLPRMDGSHQVLQFTHRLLALLVFGHMFATWRRARAATGRVRTFSNLVLAAFVAQVLVGGANVISALAPAAVLGHVALGGLTWAAVIGLAVAVRTSPIGAVASPLRPSGGVSLSARVMAYVQLTKPRIIVLLLITTIPAMVLADHRVPPFWLVLATLIGGMLTAGSANAINQFLDRDIDDKMNRTRSRPLPSHKVTPLRALMFGALLGVIGTVWLVITVNVLSALLAAAAIAFYVGVYTIMLKRSTPQNIVIGGAAGAVPALIGWSAVTGTLSPAAWVMFAIIFFWTPPHFWALAVKYRDDYAAAGVPMMPVVAGLTKTSRSIVLYSLVLIATTFALMPVAGMGVVYAVSAGVLGAGFLYLAVLLLKNPDTPAAMRLFKYSISYLALLFLAIAVDSLR